MINSMLRIVPCWVVCLGSSDSLDIAVYVCFLQRNASQPRVEHYIKLNRVTKWVKKKSLSLRYFVVPGPLKFSVVSDSAFRKEDETGLSVRGAI